MVATPRWASTTPTTTAAVAAAAQAATAVQAAVEEAEEEVAATMLAAVAVETTVAMVCNAMETAAMATATAAVMKPARDLCRTQPNRNCGIYLVQPNKNTKKIPHQEEQY